MVRGAGLVASAKDRECEYAPGEEEPTADESGEVTAVEHLEQVAEECRNDDDCDVATDGVALLCMVAHGLALS